MTFVPVRKNFFLAGKQGASIVITITPYTYGASGALTVATGGSLRGQFKSVKVSSKPSKENISSNDSGQANNVILEENLQITFSEMQVNGVGGNVLNNVLATADVFGITFAYGNTCYGYASTASVPSPIWVTRGDFEDGITSKGNGTLDATFDLTDAGQIAAGAGVMPFTQAGTW